MVKKEFTVGDFIKILEKFDKDLPIYDHFFDEEVGGECWFNMEKPKPKAKNIYLRARKIGKKMMGEWSEEKAGGEVLETKKILLMYPPEKGVIEIG